MIRDSQLLLAGIDEVGRGSLAGPVTAAAVILGSGEIAGLADSKLLGPGKRRQLGLLIREKAVVWCVACASVGEIERINILQASLLAMLRAAEGLLRRPDKILVDGNCLPKWSFTATAVVGGDRKIKAISAASILAKVWRDDFMTRLHQQYPLYDFASNKGYPTPAHLMALHDYGASPVHRHSFAPVRRVSASTTSSYC